MDRAERDDDGAMQNILTINVEEWYHLNYASMGAHQHHSLESRVRENTDQLLVALSARQAQATFFFLGTVAEAVPELVRQVKRMGHEIASHGYAHELVSSQTREEFTADVRRSVDILQAITGDRVLGYRAPSWSVSDNTPWAFEVLQELGFLYSASLFPYKTYLYGDGKAPVYPFVRQVNGQKLYEFPATVLQLKRFRVPFGGGFYFRAMPYWATWMATHLVNRAGRPVVFYLHPREIDPAQPRLALPLIDYFVTYANLGATLRKLDHVLRVFPTISIKRYLELNAEAIK